MLILQTSFRNHELLEQSVSGQNSRFQVSIYLYLNNVRDN